MTTLCHQDRPFQVGSNLCLQPCRLPELLLHFAGPGVKDLRLQPLAISRTLLLTARPASQSFALSRAPFRPPGTRCAPRPSARGGFRVGASPGPARVRACARDHRLELARRDLLPSFSSRKCRLGQVIESSVSSPCALWLDSVASGSIIANIYKRTTEAQR